VLKLNVVELKVQLWVVVVVRLETEQIAVRAPVAGATL
jgi:hypothetical protein